MCVKEERNHTMFFFRAKKASMDALFEKHQTLKTDYLDSLQKLEKLQTPEDSYKRLSKEVMRLEKELLSINSNLPKELRNPKYIQTHNPRVVIGSAIIGLGIGLVPSIAICSAVMITFVTSYK